MAQVKHTTIPRKFNHLTLDQRGMIAAYNDSGLSTRQIGQKLGCNHSTISRELRRGCVLQRNSDLTERHEYYPDVGQRVYNENRLHCGTRYKLAKVSAFVDHAERMLRDKKWSPDVIVGEYRTNPKTAGLPTVCTKTLYNYIDQGLMKTKNIDLLLKVGRKVRKKVNRTNKRILGESIESRPEEIAARKTFGHWEIDTVIGRKTEGQSLLTLLERKTRAFLIRPLEEHTAEGVGKALATLRSDFGASFSQVFKTITADNGSEFYELTEQLSSYGSKAYFCHPYSSWEKGANEKHNSLIRRFLPKGTSFADLTPETITRIENWCNNLPRKILGYLTPSQVFQAERQGVA